MTAACTNQWVRTPSARIVGYPMHFWNILGPKDASLTAASWASCAADIKALDQAVFDLKHVTGHLVR